ncbi:DDE superfamily endonuclease [Metarhizium robertsii]|uniref:DDE superfamily endonuclease n=1 Tax=Metarhizium robertsii TaxID=568076 RepID=A0A014PFS9_9HYPO|nr:DDE superfamily endonuclease [Metarhizium robertsii]
MSFSEKTLQAARAVLTSRNPPRDDLRRTTTPQRNPLSVRDAASAYKVRNPLPRGRGRPMALTDDEDDALVALRRNPNSSGVSPNWLTGWRRNHPEITQTYLKAVERSRKAFEAQGLEDVELFYSQLQATILKFRIGASEMWNEDEAGMRIGCLRERVQVLVTRTSRHKAPRPEVLDPANRESCTVIASINAMGDSLPPWLVFAHYPTTNWAGIDIGTGVRFAQSPTGFSNAEIHLEWARHFNRWSWASSAQAKQSGKSLEQWFGCDEHLRLPDRGMSRVERPPVDRPDEEKIYRLLVVDGFTGHTTLAFAEYCIKFDIIIAILPPHSTHLMQPLDVGVFQPLTAAHQKALRKFLAEGNLTFSRVECLAAFQQVYEAGFTRHNIMSGFEEAEWRVYQGKNTQGIADAHFSSQGPDAEDRDDYKKTKKQVVNGRVKQLNFKPWLEHTGRDVEFYLLEQSHDTLTQELKRPSQEIYFIDTTKRNNSARDIMARAMTRPHPLEDMSSLPGSDDTVHFPGLSPFREEREADNNDDLEFQFHDA